MNKNLAVNLILLLVAAIWGIGFIPQKLGMNYMSASAFNAMRFALGAVTLIPVMMYMASVTMRDVKNSSTVLLGSIVGALLFFGALMQQISLQYTSVANVAFITGLYTIMVPLIGFFLGYRYTAIVWFGGSLAIIGLYLIAGGGTELSLKGDLIALVGALFWAIHLLVLVKRAGPHQVLVLAFYQFVFCAFFSLVFSLVYEDSLLPTQNVGYLWPVLNGFIVVGIAYTLQVIVLPQAEPFAASMILALEAVFGALAAYFVFAERLGMAGILGAGLMLLGCILAQRDSATEARAID